MRLRRNPSLYTDYAGRLKTPSGATLWIHTTDTPAADFMREGFAFKGDTFYLTSGCNLSFGPNVLFIEYRPTRIFDAEDSRGRAELMACIRARTTPESVRDGWLSDHADVNGVDLGRYDVYEYIDDQLEHGAYAVFEGVPSLRACLESLGYTAYFENEGGGFSQDHTNIAVFAADFPRLKIVGAVDARRRRDGSSSGYYICPRCSRYTEIEEIVEHSQQSENGETIQCRCSSFDTCSQCGKYTHPDEMHDEYTSDSETVSLCGDCALCHQCEAPVPASTLTPIPGSSFVCPACLEAGPPDDDDDDDF